MIPRRIVRTVPEVTSSAVEEFWDKAVSLHPGWEHVTLRDPIDADRFPLTAHAWDRCTSGAQRAGLIRLEELFHNGGHYIDSDVELYRPLVSLTPLHGYAAWEDSNAIPDAVLGFEPGHPVLPVMIAEALERIEDGAWQSGPGVTTRNLRDRDDVLILPPGSFYPYHYSQKDQYDLKRSGGRRKRNAIPVEQPWAFGAHHWHYSWRAS